MTMTEILQSDASATEKLTQLSQVVSTIRTAYGNPHIDIDVPEVNTSEGVSSMKYLSSEDKLALAERAIKQVILIASEACEEQQGVLFDKEVESLVAVSPVLTNLLTSTDSKYI